MKRHTKIVCTLGPGVHSQGKIKELIAAGMNVARLNCSHGDWEAKAELAAWVRECSNSLAPVALLADLQGPKFRIGVLPSGSLELAAGQSFTLGTDPSATMPIPPDSVWNAMRAGDRALLGDGDVEIKLGERKGDLFDAKAVTGGTVKSKQGITLVGRSFDAGCLTEKDLADIYEACKLGVDFIALSYVREASDMKELRRLVDRYDPKVRLVAKIETKEALKHIDEIIRVSDVLMVARGDLGLQMDIEDVPAAQKRIIEKCNLAGKPVITATQMLESMIKVARPTRAEASDVANAIHDGTDAVMLSGETATGAYPVEAVKVMARIAEKTDPAFEMKPHLIEEHHAIEDTPTDAVAHAAVNMAHSLKAKAIVTTTTSGTTPRMVSKYRPRVPIYCACWDERAHRQMAVIRGVESVLCSLPSDTDESIGMAIETFMRMKKLKVGDLVIVTAGVPAGKPGNTNLIYVQTV